MNIETAGRKPHKLGARKTGNLQHDEGPTAEQLVLHLCNVCAEGGGRAEELGRERADDHTRMPDELAAMEERAEAGKADVLCISALSGHRRRHAHTRAFRGGHFEYRHAHTCAMDMSSAMPR